MKSNKVIPVVCVTLAVTLLSGCLWAPELDSIRRDIERQLPGSHFKKEIAFSLGTVTLALVKAAVRLVPGTDEARSYLKEIKNVKVAVYEVENVPADVEVRIPRRLKSLLENGEWELAVKTRDDGDAVWILYRLDDEAIQGLYVVVLDADELVLVRAHGRLDRLFEKAMRENMNLYPIDEIQAMD